MTATLKATTQITIPSHESILAEKTAQVTATHDRADNVVNLNYEMSHDAQSYRVEMRQVGVKNSTVEVLRGDFLPARGDIRLAVTPEMATGDGAVEFILHVVPIG